MQETLRKLGEVPASSETGEPELEVLIVDCGLNKLANKYDLAPNELDSQIDRK